MLPMPDIPLRYRFGESAAAVYGFDLCYAKTYKQTPDGYDETAVRDAAGFANARGGFAIAHGTGDDNAHY